MKIVQSITVKSPAKINFCLAIDGRLSSGMHLIRSVVCPISLFDEISIELSVGNSIEVSCCFDRLFEAHQKVIEANGGESLAECKKVLSSEKNLVFRAVRALLEDAGVLGQFAVKVLLKKVIPTKAGLGGGSSNAATTLKALSGLLADCKLPGGLLRQSPGELVSEEKLHKIAAGLGSDVPVLLGGGIGYLDHTGENTVKIKPASPEIARLYSELGLVIVKPAVEIHTAMAYQQLGFGPGSGATKQPSPSEMLAPLGLALQEVNKVDPNAKKELTLSEQDGICPLAEFRPWELPQDSGELITYFVNDFEKVVPDAYPQVREVIDALSELGASRVLLSGSGSAVAAFTQSRASAVELEARLSGSGSGSGLGLGLAKNWFVARAELLM